MYAFLASEEYAKESIKDLKINQESVFDKNAAGSNLAGEKPPIGPKGPFVLNN